MLKKLNSINLNNALVRLSDLNPAFLIISTTSSSKFFYFFLSSVAILNHSTSVALSNRKLATFLHTQFFQAKNNFNSANSTSRHLIIGRLSRNGPIFSSSDNEIITLIFSPNALYKLCVIILLSFSRFAGVDT